MVLQLHKKVILAVLGVFFALFLVGYFLTTLVTTEKVALQTDVTGMIGFLFIVILEVIFAPIPGGIIGYLGAGTFGFWRAWTLLYIGNIVGCVVVYWLARKYGAPYVEKFIDEKDRVRYLRYVHGNKIAFWFIYAVPVFPIDFLSIMAGFAGVPFRIYMFIVGTALISHTGLVSLIGSYFANYIPFLETLAVVMFVLVLSGIVLFILREYGPEPIRNSPVLRKKWLKRNTEEKPKEINKI